MNCRNCNQNISEKYCGNCGMPVVLTRVDSHYIVHEIQHILHFEKGILYTVKALLLQPGQSIRAFLTEDRSRLVKPVIFLIITSLIYTTIAHFFHLERTNTIPEKAAHSATIAIMAWIEGHYGYSNIIMGIIIGGWLKLIYKKNSYNFFEILIMLCFVIGTGMLLFAIFTLAQGITGINLQLVGGTLTFIYCVWAIGQFLDGKKALNYLFALIAYLLGIISFTVLAVLIGLSIDILTTI